MRLCGCADNDDCNAQAQDDDDDGNAQAQDDDYCSFFLEADNNCVDSGKAQDDGPRRRRKTMLLF